MKPNFTLIAFFLAPFFTVHAQNVSTLLTDGDKNFESIHWHSDGRIYSADYNNGRLYQVFLDGTVQTIVSGIPNIAGGGFDDTGNFYFSGLSGGKLYRLENNNSYTEIATGLNQPTGVAAYSSDTLIVGQYGNNSLAKVCISTGAVSTWVSGNGISGPDAVIRDGSNGYVVANFNNTMIHKVGYDGQVSLLTNIPEAGFLGYVIPVNNSWFSPAFSARKIYQIDSLGVATAIAGTGATGSDDGAANVATFINPNGICVNPGNDTLLVTDDSTIRIITEFEQGLSAVTEVEPLVITLFPNPASDELNVKFCSPQYQNITWRILDDMGKEVKRGQVSGTYTGNPRFEIDIHDLPRARYSIKVEYEQGTLVKTFLKQ